MNSFCGAKVVCVDDDFRRFPITNCTVYEALGWRDDPYSRWPWFIVHDDANRAGGYRPYRFRVAYEMG